MTIQQWLRIPEELRQRPQWLLAGPNDIGQNKVPLSFDAAGNIIDGSSTNRATWRPFEQVAQVAAARGLGIGYVLSADDPFTCVDLDVKDQENAPGEPDKWTTPAQWDLFRRIVAALESYTEASTSGKGMHIWVRANIGRGVKREGVEIYSQERFIVCTGNVYIDLPIADRQAMVANSASQMRTQNDSARDFELVELDEDEDDETIWVRAANADNKDKFLALVGGDWASLGYPSQSEADLSLMSMFTFYSRSNEQCRRLFRMSGLGKRPKATKNDRHLNYMLRLIRHRQSKEAQADAMAAEQAAALAASLAPQVQAVAAPAPAPLPGPAAPAVAPIPGPAAGEMVQPAPALPQAQDDGLPWPPGLAGALAGFVYRNAPRPVKEVAIVAALGWLAGVCGKAWQIPQSGLNMYIILVARSAVGKEAMHSGLGALLERLRSNVPTAQTFVDFNDYVSGPALIKACAEQSSFVNVAGEWGRKLRKLAQDSDRDGPMQTLRTVMTNLYQKSGATSVVGGLTYSNKDNNVGSINGVAFSMIGESTPGTFYDALTETMMEDGFLSRFTVVEYTGDRPPMNPNPQPWPEPELVEQCSQILVQAGSLISQRQVTYVQRDTEAADIMGAFDAECDREINSTTDESWRQMWNRAHLKMTRVAALLAVGDNHLNPVIRAHHVTWALELIRRDIAIMQRRLEGGDIGTSDNSRERKLLSICREYLTAPSIPAGYKIPPALKAAGIIPRKYLQIRTQRSTAFTTAKQGANRAIDETLRAMMDNGYIAEMPKGDAAEHYGFLGRCFRVINIPDWANVREK